MKWAGRLVGLHLLWCLLLRCMVQGQNTPPIFEAPAYAFNFEENMPEGSEVGVVTARDNENDELEYSFQSASDDSLFFRINSNTGVISNALTIDRENLISPTLRIFVRVADPSGADAIVQVIVTIVDVNDNSPIFGNLPRSLDLPENTPIDTSVFQARASDADQSLNAAILYSLVPNDTFSIDPSTGVVTLDQGLDFDAGAREYILTILAQDRALADPITSSSLLTIAVEDINDQDPQFSQEIYLVQIHENLTMDSRVFRVNAIDGDRGVDDDILFTITSGNLRINGTPSFFINESSGWISVNAPFLDREQHAMYTLVVTGTERMSSNNRASATVEITILDINDHIPSFDMLLYEVSISELAQVNDTLFTLMATDPDEGVHGNFVFSLLNVTDEYELPFDVSSHTIENTGQATITLTQEVDFEQRQIYRFMIIATETVQEQSRSGFAEVIVNVENENDNDPMFSQDVYAENIPENNVAGTFVVQVLAMDGDDGSFGNLTFRFSDADGDKPFNIFTEPGGLGLIQTSRVLDYEEDTNYTLTVIVEDSAADQDDKRSDTASVIVTVNNLNDNPPQFVGAGDTPLDAIAVPVLEEIPSPFTILALQAIDADGPLNELSFEIVSETPDFGHFEIDRETGVINTTIDLDFDLTTRPRFPTLNISVNDTEFVDYLTVNIEVVDINDNSPQFDNDTYSFDVVENTPSGSVIGQVQATDIDSGTFGQIEYYISGPAEVTSRFGVNSSSGEIYVIDSIDREETSGPFQFVVIATDSDSDVSQRNMDNVSVTLFVTDRNDNRPSFLQDDYLFVVAENADQLSGLNVSATDPDEGTNGRIMYSILEGNEEEAFILDEVSGVITRNATVILDFERTQMYTLNVSAEDMGYPSNVETVQVLILISDQNDEIPTFSMQNFNTSIFEDVISGSSIAAITARDDDSGLFGLLTYAIVGVVPDLNETFTIDNTTGIVRTDGTFDRERFPGPYIITIGVRDGGDPPNSGSTTLEVDILDVNDQVPTFAPAVQFPDPAEEQVPGYAVAELEAEDLDQSDTNNSRITYSISGVAATPAPDVSIDFVEIGQHFALNLQASGVEIVTNTSLDFELIRSYEITVTATDSGEPVLSSETVVLVDVVDINDHAPEFIFTGNASTYSLEIPENSPFLRFPNFFVAIDEDSTSNGMVEFVASNIYTFPSPPFSISGDQLTVAGNSLDFEAIQSYRFNVTVRDMGTNVLTDEALVEITILDENDNSPMFLPDDMYAAAIAEGNYTGTYTTILLVNASDVDSGEFGNVSYEVFPENPLFSVEKLESGEGEVRVEGILDREMIDEHRITILARDGGIPPNTGTATVVITVTDVNDNAPVLNARQYTAMIPEEADPLQVSAVLANIDISATDADIGANGEVQYLLSNDTDFEIDLTTAEIQSLRTFDFEVEKSFALEVIAFDNATVNSLIDVAQLTITIIDINDNSPFFVAIPSNLSYSEDTPVGAFIANITADDLDSGSNAQLTFQLANDEGKFSINDDGCIVLADSLDRESTSSYNITVTVSDRGQPPLSATDYLYIEVTDINDVSPQLERDSYNFLVPEDAELNTTVGTIVAFDLDEDVNGNIFFEIILGDTDLFSLVSMQTDARQTFSAMLVNNEPFDYETETSYSIAVNARNTVPPYFNVTADVAITVRDTNDNPPMFTMPGGYVITVPEAAIVSRPVGTVVANDDDGGLNGTVVYSFAPGTDSLVTDTFTVNATTGVIILAASLNFENIDSYEFYVEARDRSAAPLTSNVSVIIIVEDTNENAPMFDMGGYSASLGENLPAGTLVTRVNATERETGGSSVVYSLVAGETQQFVIDEVTGIITTNTSLDREVQDSYVLTVQARDMATFPLSSFVQVVIQVTDVNDNDPTFGISSAQVRLAESSPIGTRLPQVFLATDRDIGTNAEIRYSILPDDDFMVDPQSGVISVRNPTSLDRETTPSISLILRATDRGSIPRASELAIEVILDDINDNTPIFMPATYTATIRENSDAGVSVALVGAVDADIEPALRYAIVSGDDTVNKFRINAVSGLIVTTAATLDRESQGLYELMVSATDSGTPSRTGSAIVTVFVADENDHTPQCLEAPFSFSTDEANSNQVVLGIVAATDGDGAGIGSGQLVYQLASSNLGNTISVSSSGTVFGQPGLDFEAVTGGSFLFDVLVRDQPADAATSRSVNCQVMVTLRDVNDHIPMFEEPLYEAAVVESATVGERVVIVRADDLDSGRNGEVRYSIPSTSVPFSIDSVSGEVTVAGALDSDTNSLYEVDIEAVDLGSAPRIGITRLRVTIIDINDNSPRFDRTFYEQTISENVALDTTVLTVQATDRDSINPQHTILSGNIDDTFRIEATSGVIQVSKSLDREAVPVFNLVISAEDDGGNTGTTLVRIVVLDVNDEFPVFQQASYTAFINENSLEGTAVLPFVNGSSVRIQAIDADEPNTLNSRVVYTLEGEDATSFSIDSSSGIVTVARGASLDFEFDPVLEVTVVASDSDPATPMTSSVTLTINLVDINDVAPQFSSPFGYVLSIPEDQEVDRVISTEISAVDSETVGGMVQYELTSAIPFSSLTQFSINRTTGQLSLLESLDRETDSTITLVVTASDMGEPALSSVVNVQITVSDINDNPPRFGQDIYTTTVPEFLAVGGSALQITAVDPDAPGFNSEVRYRVLDTTTFTINPVTGDITTVDALDHETVPFHQFRVEGCDRGSPMQCATTMIRINVGDFNDHPPIFDQGLRYYTDICFTNAVRGVDLIQPVATDADSTSNAELVYSLTDEPTLFTLDPANGRISLSRTAVVTDIRSHDFTIVATDGGDTPLSGSTLVTVRVLNCSEHDLYFRSPFHYLEIDEGFDRFTDNSASVTLAISRSPQDVSFIPYPANPFTNILNNIRLKPFADLLVELRERAGLNREARSLYTVSLRAADGTGLQTFTSVTLQVLDVNDNSPEFPSDLVVFSVPENQTAPYSLGAVMATDLDEDVITYRVQSVSPPSTPEPFSIDTTSGLISTTVELDREQISQYDIMIEATDGVNSDTITVRVGVLDINDCDPTFVQDEYRIAISENLPQGSSVAAVSATDCDVGANAELRYSIAAGSLGVFQLDLISGVITTLTPLDFEQTSSYSLTVTATDMGLPNPRSGTVDVVFTIVDFNDCPPEFLNPDTEVGVPEDLVINSVLETYMVRDCDSGLNGVNGTRFSILTGDEETFALNADTGVLRTIVPLDREEQATYILSIRAMDSAGVNSLSSITELTVRVEDVNDNSPAFAEDEVSIRVTEGEELSQTLLTLTASDVDIGRNSEIRYSLVGGEGTFSIDEVTGGLFLVDTLDRETNDSYVLSVVARDSGLEPRSSNATVYVTVLDENDNDPEIVNIDSGVTTVDVSEGSDIGTVVFRVNATDRDLGVNANVRFSLDDTSMNLPFTLVGDVIQVNGDLDFEQQIIYSLVVIAEDTGEPTSRRSFATLVVQVTDSNDNDPMFVDMPYDGEQDEGQEIGTSILRVQANDADSGENAEVVYSLAEGSDVIFFSIDNETGIIVNNITLDREDRDSYMFEVVATNYLTPDNLRSGTATVTITVGDINDETPRFDAPLYTTQLTERTPVGVFVLDVRAQDNDLANTPNSDLVYSLDRVGNVPFFIDQNTGRLTVQNVLDYETATSYNFDVVVEDKGAPPLRNTSTVIINITDVNDQAPRFSQSVYTLPLLENTTPRTILSFQYADGDSALLNTQSTLQITSVVPENDDLFSISSNLPGSGTITINDEVDFESVQGYSLSILVQNTQSGVGEACSETEPGCLPSSTAVVNVDIVDSNDNSPMFAQSMYSGEVSSTALTGTSILAVRATDADATLNFRSIVYRLGGTGPSSQFRIGNTTGTLFTRGSFDGLDGSVYTITVEALDNNGMEPFNMDTTTIELTVLRDFQRIAIIFNISVDVISAKENEIVSLLRNLTGYEIVVEQYREYSTNTLTTFIFHAIQNGDIIDFDQFFSENLENELFSRLERCRIIRIQSFGDVIVPQGPLDRETIVILVLCLFLIIGAIILLIASFSQRYLALHANRNKLLADVFYGSHAGSSLIIDNLHHENIQLQLMEASGQSTNKQNPMFVQPYDNWAGVDTSGVESVGGDSALQRDNPLYESQEIRMEMFADVSDEEEEGDEADEAELLAAALQDDSEVEDEDNSVTAI